MSFSANYMPLRPQVFNFIIEIKTNISQAENISYNLKKSHLNFENYFKKLSFSTLLKRL